MSSAGSRKANEMWALSDRASVLNFARVPRRPKMFIRKSDRFALRVCESFGASGALFLPLLSPSAFSSLAGEDL